MLWVLSSVFVAIPMRGFCFAFFVRVTLSRAAFSNLFDGMAGVAIMLV
jgi:hypothetical protein